MTLPTLESEIWRRGLHSIEAGQQCRFEIHSNTYSLLDDLLLHLCLFGHLVANWIGSLDLNIAQMIIHQYMTSLVTEGLLCLLIITRRLVKHLQLMKKT